MQEAAWWEYVLLFLFAVPLLLLLWMGVLMFWLFQFRSYLANDSPPAPRSEPQPGRRARRTRPPAR